MVAVAGLQEEPRVVCGGDPGLTARRGLEGVENFHLEGGGKTEGVEQVMHYLARHVTSTITHIHSIG